MELFCDNNMTCVYGDCEDYLNTLVTSNSYLVSLMTLGLCFVTFKYGELEQQFKDLSKKYDKLVGNDDSNSNEESESELELESESESESDSNEELGSDCDDEDDSKNEDTEEIDNISSDEVKEVDLDKEQEEITIITRSRSNKKSTSSGWFGY